MTLQIASTDTIGPGYRITLTGTDSLFVKAGVLVASTDGIGVLATGNYSSITVAGSIAAEEYGIRAGSPSLTSSGMRVSILSGGSVTSVGTSAVGVFGTDAYLENNGSLSGANGCLLGGDYATLVNHGQINASGTATGIAVEMYDASSIDATATRLINFGTITSGDISVYGDANSKDTIRNFGTIVGDIFQFDGDDLLINRGLTVGLIDTSYQNDTVDNRGGTIEGDVLMGYGNDRYVGTGGTIIGAVYGGGGADTFFGNENSADVFVGGADVDTLDFRLGGQVTLALDLSFAQNGAALGDTYFEMENVFGSDVGNDVIRGNPAANALFGWGGNDSLDGAGGADVLRGGTGVDTLTGGTGDDTFRFSALTECGDLITDFAGNLGNNDRFQITAAAFGGGLVAGVLAANQFITRADNLAQDADDRFIFNTTDRTLWFDADGNGAGAAVMVADLQAGAVVTAADILLI